MPISSPAPFFMVWNPNGRAPAFRHANKADAVVEAERLAHLKPGETFVVLATVCARRLDAMQRIDLQPEEVPF